MNYYYSIHEVVRIDSNIPLSVDPIPPLQECRKCDVIEPNLVVRVEKDVSIPVVGLSKIDRFYGKRGSNFLYFRDIYYKRKYNILLKNVEGKTEIYATKPTTKMAHKVLRGNLYDLISAIIQIKLIKTGYLYVHGACLSKNNSAILLPAFCGVGKTITTFHLLNEDFKLISDDLTLVDNKGFAYFSYSPSTVSYEDFIKFVRPQDIGKWKYYKMLLRSWIVENNPALMRFFPLPKLNLLKLSNGKLIERSRVNVVCILELGDKQVKEVSKEYVAKKILEINEYSLERFYRNRLLWIYAYFNDFDIAEILEIEKRNLLSFLNGCKCYILSCNDQDWIPLIRKIYSEVK